MPKTNKIIEELREKRREWFIKNNYRIRDRKEIEQFLLKALATQRKEMLEGKKQLAKEMAEERVKAEIEARKEIVREIEAGLPKERGCDKQSESLFENRKIGYNQYRREVKEFLKKYK